MRGDRGVDAGSAGGAAASGVLLVATTISYNVVEAGVAHLGDHRLDVALIGFGLDSVTQVGSAATVAWQFSGSDPQPGN